MALYKLEDLPYSYDSLEPYFDVKTMEFHHSKHHQGYVNKLNDILKDYPELNSRSIEELLKNLHDLPETIRDKVQNFGGGHANHSLFWKLLKKNNGAKPRGKIGQEIIRQFGSFESFQDQFNAKAAALFGSGWVWLVLNKDGNLEIVGMHNQDTPLSFGIFPILTLDLWEHAYYLKYQNKRTDFISAWWHVINWDHVEESSF